MNKKQLNKLILILIATPAFALSAMAGVDFDAGMNAYNKENYDFAKTLFRKAIEKDYYDVDARYMYTQILIKEKKYTEAKKEYAKIIELAPGSKAGDYAKKGIAKIDEYYKKLEDEKKAKQQAANTETAQTETAKDYVKNAYRGGQKYLRERGIIRVYIEPDSTFQPLMKEAYSEWQDAIGQNIMFSFVGDKSDATDVVSFGKSDIKNNLQEGGLCQYKISENNLTGSTISINAYDSEGKSLPKEIVYHTMLHEIGHSLGIMGHSPYKGDIMSQGVNTFRSNLSDRDKTTIRLLYTDYLKEPDKSDIYKAKAEELEDIAKRIPNNANSYIDMGDELMSEKQYDKALIFYKKAELIQPSEHVYLREIKAYDKLGDIDNVITHYKKILEINPKNITALNNLLVIYQNQARFREGRTLLDEFIKKNPDLTTDKDVKQMQKVFSDENIKAIEARKNLFNRIQN